MTAEILTAYNALAREIGFPPRTAFHTEETGVEAFTTLQFVAAEILAAKSRKERKLQRQTPARVKQAPKHPKLRAVAPRVEGERRHNVNSKAWLRSCQSASGICLIPSKLDKLIATAKAHGVQFEGLTQAEIAQAVSAKLSSSI